MTGPQRLRDGGRHVTRELLDSARLDKPSRASLDRALQLAATAGAFVTTTAGATPASNTAASASLAKAVALWVCVGALGGGLVAFGISALLGPGARPGELAPLPPTPQLVLPELPAAAHAAAPSSAQASDLDLDLARAALARGDASAALASLDRHDARQPSGAESTALRVQALSAAGDLVKARALASDFEQKYPSDPLLSTVRSAAKLD